MGLVKTVFSPLTNTTPLVSIILVIILVAIFRFSGGGLSVTDKNAVNENTGTSERVKVNVNNKNELPKEGTIKIDANEFERLIKLRPTKKNDNNKKNDSNSNNFDSIEAELGLK